MIVIGLTFAYLMLRFSRMGCEDLGETLRVKNWFTEEQIPWAEVRGFSAGRFGYWPNVLKVDRLDGSVVPIVGIQERAGSSRMAIWIAELSELLNAHRGT